jgi:hypothetical protein
MTSQQVSRDFHRLWLLLVAIPLLLLLLASPTMAQDCRAIQGACVASCLGGSGATGDLSQVMRVVPEWVKACITRCAIAPCEQTPLAVRVCDETAQSICNNGFQACGDACLLSTAAKAAEVQSQAACSTFCCSQLKACLAQRQCALPTIVAINCVSTLR